MDFGYDPVVSDTVLPKCAEAGPFQGLADAARIIEVLHSIKKNRRILSA